MGLLELTAELVSIPSVSRDEAALADLVEQRLRTVATLTVERIGDSVIGRTSLGRDRRLLLAGHLDTVPPFAAIEAHLDDGAVSGLGAVDMKGGLAVMLDLAGALESAACDVTLVFYAAEEIERDANALGQLARRRPELLSADAAVLGEPTGGVVEAGCQGTMRAEVVLAGRRAHTARPWAGVNAVHRLAPLLEVMAAYEPRQVELDGCTYAEQLQAVRVSGGVAGNVVPDEAVLTVNYRFAPDRDERAAETALRVLLEPALGPGDELRVVDSAPAAAPGLDHPLLASVVAASGAPARAKVGWTDVATISALGIPATNFGPGDPSLAHTPDERVSSAELDHVRAVLGEVLGIAPGR